MPGDAVFSCGGWVAAKELRADSSNLSKCQTVQIAGVYGKAMQRISLSAAEYIIDRQVAVLHAKNMLSTIPKVSELIQDSLRCN